MAQQQAPWLETAYGWAYGENGWNAGMDSNLLKFSVMFDRNIDSIVASLPPAVNGQVHYNTTDNRIYFAVNNSYFSTPVPKWFTVVVRSTGATWQFNGSALSIIESASSLDSRLDAVELTLSNLGSAAFEDVSAFATQDALDVVEGQAQAYTDVLRNDLANTSTGSDNIGYNGLELTESLDRFSYAYSEFIRPQDFGAVGNGVADDTVALQGALSDGRPVYWGDASKTYRITSSITVTLTKQAVWLSSGATIFVDSAASIQHAIMVNAPGHNVTIRGPLALDANRKCFIGFWFQNTSTTTYADLTAEDLSVRNIYRNSDVFTIGGTGIYIRGGFRNVFLVRPDVRNVALASGAGVLGFRGVTGISITAMTLGPQEVTILHPYIDGIYSEDVAYTVDQDGIVLFAKEDDGTASLHSSHFSIFGGKFKNCGGRGIKSQMEFGHVNGTHFVRNNEIASITRTGSMPEIDFQVGGGLIENIECNYNSSAPHRLVQITGSRQATPLRYAGGVKVDGVRVSRTGANPMTSLVDIRTYYTRIGLFDIKNIVQADSVTLLGSAINISGEADNGGNFLFNIENVYGRPLPGSSFVLLTRPAGTSNLVGRNVYSSEASTTFASNSGAGAMVTKLEGLNINIV